MKIKQYLPALILDLTRLRSFVFTSFTFVFIFSGDFYIIGSIHPAFKILFVFVLTYLGMILNYIFSYYVIEDDHIDIYSGYIVKNKQTILYDKITTINSNQTLTSRMLNAHKISIETNDTNMDIEKLVVSQKDFEIIKDIKNKENQVKEQVIQNNNEYYTSNNNLLKFAFSKVNIFASISIITTFIFFLEDYLDTNAFIEELFDNTVNQELIIIIITIIFSLLLFIFISMFRTFTKFYGFKIVDNDKFYQISYGLFTKYNFSLKKEYINGIIIKQSLINKLFKQYDIYVINAGYKNNDEDQAVAPYLMLGLPKKELDNFLRVFANELSEYKKGVSPSKKAYTLNFILAQSILLIICAILINFTSFSIKIIMSIFLIEFVSHLSIFLIKLKYNNVYLDKDKLYCTNITFRFLNFQSSKYIVKTNTLLKLEDSNGPFKKICQSSDLNINLFSDDMLTSMLLLSDYPNNLYQEYKQIIIKVN